MRQPVANRFACRIQEIELGCRGDQITKCENIPSKPKSDQHKRASDYHIQRRCKIPQISPLTEIHNREDHSQSEREQQSKVGSFGQARRREREPSPNCEEQTWAVRLKHF